MDTKSVVDRARELANENLSQCVSEIVELRKTGVIPNGKVREIEAICQSLDKCGATRIAEDFVVSAALERLVVNPKQESLKDVIRQIPQQPQRQDALNDQLRDLRFVANRLGMYDAADYLRDLTETEKASRSVSHE